MKEATTIFTWDVVIKSGTVLNMHAVDELMHVLIGKLVLYVIKLFGPPCNSVHVNVGKEQQN